MLIKLCLLTLVVHQAGCKDDSASRDDADADVDVKEDSAPPLDAFPRDAAAVDVALPDARRDANVKDSRLPDAAIDAEDDDGGIGEGYQPTGFLEGNKPNSFVQVAIGAHHGCGLRADGTLRCWGQNSLGQCDSPPGKFSKISAGVNWSCGQRAGTNEWACWGYGAETLAPKGEFARIEVGGPIDGAFATFACGLRPSGRVQCSGITIGEAPMSLFTELSASDHEICGIKKSNRGLVCWGLGDPQADVPSGEFLQVTVGVNHSCALRTDTSLVCWGADENGSILQSTPTGKGFTEVSTGPSHTCAIRNKTVVCWGSNGDGRSDPPIGDFVRIKAGPRHTCAVKTDGELKRCPEIRNHGSVARDS